MLSLVYIILLLFALLLAGFLFTPLVVYIDTEEQRYELFQGAVFHFSIVRKDERIIPRLSVLGIRIPLKGRQDRKPSPRRKGSFHRSFEAWKFLIEQSLKSFKVKSVVVDIDTDNVVFNAQLIPFFMLVSGGPVQLSSNFQKRNYFHLDVRNQPSKIFWIGLQFFLKK